MTKKIKYISKIFYKGEARYKVRYPNYKIKSFHSKQDAKNYLLTIKDNIKRERFKEKELKKAELYGVDDIITLDIDTLRDIRRALEILPKGETLYKAVYFLNQFNAEKKESKTPEKKTTFELALDKFYHKKMLNLSDSSIKILHKRLYSLRNFGGFKVRNLISITKPLSGLSTSTKQAYISVYKSFFLWAWTKKKNYNARRIYNFLCNI